MEEPRVRRLARAALGLSLVLPAGAARRRRSRPPAIRSRRRPGYDARRPDRHRGPRLRLRRGAGHGRRQRGRTSRRSTPTATGSSSARRGDVGRRPADRLRDRRDAGPRDAGAGRRSGPTCQVLRDPSRAGPRSTAALADTPADPVGRRPTSTATRRAAPTPSLARPVRAGRPERLRRRRHPGQRASSSSCRSRTRTVARSGPRRNLYGFDMNRDWFARTQPETDGKLEVVRAVPADALHRRPRVRPAELLLPAQRRPRVPRDPGHGARLDQRAVQPGDRRRSSTARASSTSTARRTTSSRSSSATPSRRPASMPPG